MSSQLRVDELTRSNDELRAMLILADREIRKLNFGKKDTPLLKKIQQVLQEARVVARPPAMVRGRTRSKLDSEH